MAWNYRNDRVVTSQRNWWKRLSIALILPLAIAQIILLVQVFKGVSTGLDTPEGSSGFALYKNTRFESCYNAQTPPSNCSTILTNLTTIDNIDVGAYDSTGKRAYSNWCTVVSCLQGYKVIPSTPRESAYGFTGLQVWFWLNFTCITALWAFGNFAVEDAHEYCNECTGFAWYDWIFFAIDIVSVVLWLWSVGQVFSNALAAAPASFFAWFTAWRYTRALQYHPIACSLAGEARQQKRKFVMGFIVVFLLLQVIFTAAVAGVKAQDAQISLSKHAGNPPKYVCDGKFFSMAPGDFATGNATCSFDTICKDKNFRWLFTDRGFFGWEGLSATINSNGLSVILWLIFLMIACTILGIVMYVMERNKRRNGAKLYHADGSFVCVLAILMIMALYNLVTLLEALASSGPKPNKEAVVNFDQSCRVVHVSMSRWKDYLDMTQGRAVRVVKWIFNA